MKVKRREFKERERYVIPVNRQLIDVSREIYVTYYKSLRREKYLEERDIKNGTVSVDALDTLEIRGVDIIPDPDPTPEEVMVNKDTHRLLHKALEGLSSLELEFVLLMYYSDPNKTLSQHGVAKRLEISQPAVKKRHDKIIEKLRKLMKV